MENILDIIAKNNCLVSFNVSGKTLSTFKSGGVVNCVIYPRSEESLIFCAKTLTESNTKFKIIGNGSNLLFCDGCLEEIVVCTKDIVGASVLRERIDASCGANLITLSKLALANSLSGMEFCCGIPATLGGGICNNCGCYKKELADIVDYVTVFNGKNVAIISKYDCKFAYRDSIFKNNNIIIINARLQLCEKNSMIISNQMKVFANKRNLTQPKKMSLGSVFKSPEDISSAYYIEKAGLKGKQVGGAMVSTTHSGFIVNLGNATSQDYYDLAKLVQAEVLKKYGKILEREVEYIGRFKE
ncbi:MAG: UDP-N-acetylmuramate dehydrogenase [Clostridia bacterium]